MLPFTPANADVETLRVCKTIYLPSPFFSIFLERDLTPAEAWKRLCDDIMDRGQEVYCRTIIDWICIVMTKKV